MIIQISDRNFEAFLAGGAKKMLLCDFWAYRNESCKLNAATADDLSIEFASILDIGKVNVDNCPFLMARLQIHIVPCLVLYDRGKPLARFNGVAPKEEIQRAIASRQANLP